MPRPIQNITLFALLAYACLSWAADARPAPNVSQATQGETSAMEANHLRPMWIIRDYKLTPHSQWEAKDAQQWLFKSVEITAEAIRFDGQTCLQPQFIVEPMRPDDFIAWTGGITPEDLKTPAGTLELVKTGCHIEALKQYIRLPERRLIIQSHKVLFVLEANVNY